MSNFLPAVDSPIAALTYRSSPSSLGARPSLEAPRDASGLSAPQALLFIMGDVHDYPALLGGLAAHTEVHLLDPAGDGLRQIAAILAGRRELAALHLVSHAGPGCLALGSLTLDCDSLAWYPEVWMTMRAALRADASLFLYGCEVAADEGVFAAALADACGVTVVASRTLTGAAACGADWELAYRSGPVSAEFPFSAQALEQFSGVLAISDGVQNLSLVPSGISDATLTDGNWIYSAFNGGINGNMVISDSTRLAIDDFANLGITAASYLEVRLSGTGSFKLLAASVGEDLMSTVAENNFYNIYLAGYANGVQVVTSTPYSSLGVTETSYSLNLEALSGTYIDSFRVYFTGDAAVMTGALGLSSFSIGSYSTSAVVSNTSPVFVGAETTLGATQNGVASSLTDLLHVADADSAQTLIWSQSTAPLHGTLDFSGATANSGSGDIAPAGTITYTPQAGYAGTDSFTVQVSDGTALTTRTISVNVAPVVPGTPDLATASDSGSSTSDRITNSATLAFTGSGGAGDSSSTVQVFIDKDGNGSYDAGTDISGTATMSGGSWSVAGLSTSGLGDGTYHVYAMTTSATGGLRSATSAGLEFTFDQTAPTITFSGLALSADSGSSASDFITGTPAQTITATLSASPAAGDVVQGSLDSGTSWSDLTAMVSGTQLTWSGVSFSDSGTLVLRVVDSAGNASAALSQAYTFDSDRPAAPSIPVLDAASDSGSSHADGITSDSTPTISGSGETGATVTLVDSDGITVLGSSVVSAGNWSITTSGLSAGHHTLSARQTDVAGNISDASAQLAITLDTTAPAVPAAPVLSAGTDTGSSSSDAITSNTTPLLSGTAEANTTVSLYDGATLLGSTSADGSGHWTYSSVTLAPGSHSLSAKASDAAGNVSAASEALVITIDTVAPAAPGLPVLTSASDTGTPGDNRTETTAPAFTGVAEASATVRLYDTDGTTVLGSAIADAGGHWSIGSSALAVGVHSLTVRQTDVAGNVSVASASLNLTIDSPPPPVEPAIPLIDGVAVQERPVSLPGGGSGTELLIPVISADRADSSGNRGTADIPLASAGDSTLLLAQLPNGFGLTATGSNPASGASASQSLLNAIMGATAQHAGSDQAMLSDAASSFLHTVPADVPLLVQTIKPGSEGGGVLALTGTHQALQKTALVLDCSGLNPQASVSLTAVSFATVLGAATVQANTSGQILIGDGQSQKFLLSSSTPGSIFAGGGNDTFQISQAAAVSGSLPGQGGAAASVANIISVLHGGQGEDTASFAGPRSAYTVEYHDGYQLVTARATPGQHALLINVEKLQFGDQTQSVQNRAELATIDGLYQQILGRQADYRGMDFWAGRVASGVSLGQTALDILNSAEWSQKHGSGLSGNHGHDIELLYQNLFGRHSDAGGLDFWVGQMEHGATLEQVAQSFVSAPEMEAHKIGVQDWNFSS